MRTLIAVVVVGVVAPLFEPAPAVAQRLQPAALIAAEAVFIGAGDGIEEKWLTHAESEFRRQERFDLVPLPADADLLAVFSSARRGRSLVGTRLKVSQLNVIDRRTGAGLWSEDREVQWAERGTVMDLVKSLHHELEGAFAIPVPERPCGGGTEVGVGRGARHCPRRHRLPAAVGLALTVLEISQQEPEREVTAEERAIL